ncbi:glycosyltransferase family 2 protein [Candidatus Woesebacteria bacterium]|nr:glycosyltransferase family 2 protein [Candidatus Woesebacteria bacterium]
MKRIEPTISVIIPVYNEERTISSIIELFRTWGRALEIIIVNDGSSDKTLGALAQFGNSITVISYKKNRGKGYAVYKGVTKSTGEILFFFDGDVVGATHKDFNAIVEPLLSNRADMSLGAARFWSVGSFEPFKDVTGLRAVRRHIVHPVVASLMNVGYGVEFFLNDLHKDKRVATVKLAHVYILGKWAKQTAPDAILAYAVEVKDLVSQLVVQQATDLPPATMRALRTLLKHLVRVLDYFP